MSEETNSVIIYQDEVHFQIETTITRKWLPKGSKPKVGRPAGRANVPYSGFLDPKTGRLLVNKPTWFNYETTIQSFREFLAACQLKEDEKIFLILDNAPWHRKAVRMINENKDNEYADITGKMEFIFLPPYSPQLNPIEQCWRVTRREMTHNVCYSKKDTLEASLDSYFEKYSEPNGKLKSLCDFKHKN